jgi:hypothetical protein
MADKYPVPAPQPIASISAKEFKGVDFLNFPTNVSMSRSPDAYNIINDAGMFPVKAKGSVKVASILGLSADEKKVNGFGRIVVGATEKFVVHIGTKLYLWDFNNNINSFTEFVGHTLFDELSDMIVFGEKLYILSKGYYKAYGLFDDGQGGTSWQLKDVADVAYIPTTTVAKAPEGAGTFLEDVNLLSKYRKNSFQALTSTLVFQLDTTSLTSSNIVFRRLAVDGATWETVTSGITVNTTLGQVTVTAGTVKQNASGFDNIEIQFEREITGYADKIKNCTKFGIYGREGNENVIFFTGNASYPNYDWHSGTSDPTYVPDNSYAVVGQPSSAIIGYSKVGEYMSVHKADNKQDATVYLRTARFNEDLELEFPLLQAIIGAGAKSKYCFAYLDNDALFLTDAGVQTVSINEITGLKNTMSRSELINSRLLAENNLENAVAIAYDNYYWLAVNGNVYVADKRLKDATKGSNVFQYEWFFLNGRSVRCWFSHNGRLFYGNNLAEIYEYANDDLGRSTAEDGTPLSCRWATPMLNMGDMSKFKNLKNLYVLLNPTNNDSSVKITYRIEGEDIDAGTFEVNAFSFNNVDFNNFTFDGAYPRTIATNKKARRFINIQFFFENEAYDQFGLFEWKAVYVVTNKTVKRW